MRASSRARHAKPSAVRTSFRTGVTAAVLPLALAVPALATTAVAAPSAAAAVRAPVYLGIEGPSRTVTAGRHAVRVRLTDRGAPVAGAAVRFERATARGWLSAGTVRTDRQGYSMGALPFSATIRLRAVSPRRAVSREMLVSVSRPAASRTRAAAPARLATAGGFRAAALRVALAQVGKPYRYGSTGPSSFDCSGLVNYAFRSVGRSVPRTSSQLRAWTIPVSRAAARPGDLVFSPGHVGIYVRPGVMVDSPNSGGRVSVRAIYARNYTVGRVR